MRLRVWKWNKIGLQRRIMVYVGIGLLVLFGVMVFFSRQTAEANKQEVFNERTFLVKSVAQDLDDHFDHLAFNLLLASQSVNLPPGDLSMVADQVYRSLSPRLSNKFFDISSIYILDDQGLLLAAAPTTPIQSPIPTNYAQRVLLQNKPLILRSQTPLENGVPFASLVVPVTASWTGGKTLAVVADTVGVNDVLSPIDPNNGTSYSLEILAADGTILMSTKQFEKTGTISLHYPLLKKYMENGQSGAQLDEMPRGASYGEPSEPEHVAAIASLYSGPFFLVLEQPVDLALAIPRQLQNDILIVGSVGMILALIITWYTTRAVVRPVRQLQSATRAITQGGLDSVIRVKAGDEVGDLVDDIEDMRQQLRRAWDSSERAKVNLEQQVAERTQRLHETLEKVITAQEAERKRLSRELHDEQSQALSALSVSLDRLSRLLKTASPQVREEIEQAQSTSRSLLKETRRLIYDLRPSVLDDMGLEAAVRWSAETHLEAHGIEVNFQSSLSTERLPGFIEVALFRIAQEAIVNIERHAQAQHAGIDLEQSNSSVRILIWDDGQGFDMHHTQESTKNRGVGLESIQERVHLIGGDLELSSEPGKGTRVKVEVNLDGEVKR